MTALQAPHLIGLAGGKIMFMQCMHWSMTATNPAYLVSDKHKHGHVTENAQKSMSLIVCPLRSAFSSRCAWRVVSAHKAFGLMLNDICGGNV